MLVVSRRRGESFVAKGDISPDHLQCARSLASEFGEKGDEFAEALVRRLADIAAAGITVTVVEGHGKIRLGVQAPEEINILRTELIEIEDESLATTK